MPKFFRKLRFASSNIFLIFQSVIYTIASVQFSPAYILYGIFCSTYILCILKTRLISFILSERTGDLLPRRDTDSLFCGRWIFLRLPEIQWRRRSPPFIATGRCCRPHTSPLVSFYTFSLYRLITRDVFQALSPFFSPLPSRCIFSLFLALWQDTAATDNIYYKTWSSMLAFSCIFLQRTKREKKFPVWWRKWRLIGERISGVILHHCSTLRFSGFFYLSILLLSTPIKHYAILYFDIQLSL